MNSSREIIVEIFEEHTEVNFYSIRYADKEFSEAECFFNEVLDNDGLEEDIEILSKLIDRIGENGAEPRHFRNAGTRRDKVAALPEYLSSTSLRLYAIRLNEKIVILGNGGIKNTKTYNEDPFLNQCVETLKKIDRFIDSRIQTGKTIVFRKELMGDLKFYIKNEKK
ncbi:hypothetical protein BW723_12355 [Polaribacter reichenbachii]|uniref:Uncharacterized protein n=1 Tax=Polaribacter reichenbachii TaxID=996801 RepID=A0A1B8U0C8_9FLAO|nr:hypothetical protein [Polaribacter reichenbachii]APZ47026.1 hypothetical protein BW723_12355 [Polaribacter reichenbachii]AUC17668.1 hypothetical protein BTO17_02805 [Polaribacter reichenbachii]OBY65310.1 hypothetical protein LPB301_09415 [Polaribacter reichenbachii]